MSKVLAGTTIAALLALSGPAVAQQGTAELRGRVVDEQGAAVPGVTMVITNQATGQFREVVSGGDGSYFVGQLIPGVFRITAELPGFRGFERTDFAIGVGRTLDLNITMEIGALEETITVSGQAPLVDLTSAEVGGTITPGDLTELPIGNRSYFAAIATLPGIQFSPSSSLGNDTMIANGQGPMANSVTLDGATNNDDNSGTWAGGQTRVPLESVAEFQVLTNQFDAEFGRARGAVINSITKQGTNRFTGVVFNYYTSEALTAEDYFVGRSDTLTKPETNKKEFGGVIGGPIIQDKMHFFFSVERQLVNPSRSRQYNTRPDLTFSLTESWKALNTLVRVDQQINANNSWAFRWLREGAPQFSLVGDRSATLNTLQDETDNDQTSVGSYTSVLGNSKVNTFRFSHTREGAYRGSPCWRLTLDQSQCPPEFEHLSFHDNQLADSGGTLDRNYILTNTFSWFVPEMKGDHDFKFGMTYHNTWLRGPSESNLNGTFEFNTDRRFDPTDPFTYPERMRLRVGGPLITTNRLHTVEAFGQDKWKLSDRLTLSLGVRYDLEVFPLDNFDNPLGLASGEYPIDRNNISPRTSLAYDLQGDGRSVVRGGYGIFYDKVLGHPMKSFDIRNSKFTTSFERQFPLDVVDSGPANGLLPTHPLLLNFNSVDDCPANPGGPCPFVDHAFVNALFPPGELIRNDGEVVFDHPGREQPYTHQLTVGYERELAPTLSVSADYVHMDGRDLWLRTNLNPQSRDTTDRLAPTTRSDVFGLLDEPYLSDVWRQDTDGRSNYNALNLQVEKRYANNWSARLSYTLAKSNTEQWGGRPDRGNWAQVGTVLNQDLLLGPAVWNRDQILKFSGRVEIPKTGGVTMSGVMTYMSGRPLTIHNTAIDANLNGIGYDPVSAGSYSGVGDNAISVQNNGGTNGAVGPDFFQLDMRFGYRSRWLDTQTMDVFVDIFNLTNRANFNNPAGDLRIQDDFLILRTLSGGSGFPRQAQFGLRFGF